MKAKTGLALALLTLMLTGRQAQAARPENSLEAMKENIQNNLETEELSQKVRELYHEYGSDLTDRAQELYEEYGSDLTDRAQELYEEYGSELTDRAQELYEEYGSELTEKALQLYEDQKEELAAQAGRLYEEKASEAVEKARKSIQKSFWNSVSDFFSDMAVSVTDFFKGLFS